MSDERKARLIFIGVPICGLTVALFLAVLMLVGQGSPPPTNDVKPIVLTADEGKLVDLLRANWQDKAADADRKRVEYERAVIAREQASAEAGAELNRLLQSKGGKFEDYEFSWQTKTFTPKKQ